MKKANAIMKGFPYILHGADYNPEQWLHMPKILEDDIRFWKEANMNTFSVGIFSWATIEPEEGIYDFSFLDDIMDRAAEAGGKIVLATPSGARPHWMAQKYPEVLRVNERREKLLFGERHNHCFTSPVYREKVQNINRKLAERYKEHPALGLWHISNEYNGTCHCELCQQAFREWLKKKYHNSLEELNLAWWTKFWSHTITDWEQIVSPSSIGESRLHGLNLDWRRFASHQTIDFMKHELKPIREITPDIPVTSNFTGYNHDVNYWDAKEELDVMAWDNYPSWHDEEKPYVMASKTALVHDMYRCFLKKPFLIMESTPSCVNWKPVNKLLRPGMHMLQSLQAVSHGADGVMYFQFRKSRGGMEKFHGAVIDHVGHQNTRVYHEIQKLGERLKRLQDVIGKTEQSEVALILDWENTWALEEIKGYKNTKDREYIPTCEKHYYPFWKNGISIDVLDMTGDFSGYKLVIMPMLYMLRPGIEDKIEAYVKEGGTVVLTYLSGIADAHDLCYLGGWPGGKLKDILGIWVEETDSLYDSDCNQVKIGEKSYRAVDYCDLLHLQGAEMLGAYQNDFYAGRPALTKNVYGKGSAYYIAFRDTGEFLEDFYQKLVQELSISKNLQGVLPENVTAQRRGDYIFLENFGEVSVDVLLTSDYRDFETGELYSGQCTLLPREVKVLCDAGQ